MMDWTSQISRRVDVVLINLDGKRSRLGRLPGEGPRYIRGN
jgi:hypothetical protein